MTSVATKTFRRVLLGATAASAIFAAQTAAAQTGPEISENAPSIIVNNGVNPNASGPGGALSTGINGVGQMISFVQQSPTAAGLSLCSGTLINPRTVIFAAHCVNSRPAHQYGSQTGTGGGVNGNFGAITGIGTTTVTRAPLTSQGVPISFGFGATNRCTATTPGVNAGTATAPVAGNGCQAETGAYERWRNANFSSVTDAAIYNVNQVWYDTRSLEPNAVGFLYADVAMATLDTPASDIPTWAMLFSPLEGPTHGTITGYGTNGTHSSAQGPGVCTTVATDSCRPIGAIDYRRRAAENMIDILGSLDDLDEALFPGSPLNGTVNPQALYQLDFDSPGGPATFNGTTNFDIDLFDGAALPNEATTAGGDSGGPLIADQAFDRAVVVAVLSGGSRWFNGQRFSTYGTTSFYQPLYLYWEEIVANNPYVYASARPGSAYWDNPSHWVQTMDPNYQIAVDGELENGLPDFFADGPAGNGPRFGVVCNGDACADLAENETTPLETSPTPIQVPGGPGTTNFVPNNVNPVNSADPNLRVRARYYDVTLGTYGTTTLRTAVTIDRLTIDNSRAQLDVRPQGTLSVLADYNQVTGWTNVDGRLNTGEMLVLSGILSGRGVIDPSWLTLGATLVAPAGAATGTLTVEGNVVFTSSTVLNIELGRTKSDLLAVRADGPEAGLAALDGTLLLTPDLLSLPRHGQTYTVVTAQGGVSGQFDLVGNLLLGLLKPEVTYGANAVTVKLKAGSIFDFIRGLGGTAEAFGRALDALRNGHYLTFANLYGAIDVMDPQSLAMTLNRLSPDNIDDSRSLQERQSRLMLNSVTDRLSMLGTIPGGTLSVASDSGVFAAMSGNPTPSTLGFNSIVPSRAGMRALPEGMTGFVTSGYSVAGSTIGNDRFGSYGGQQTWHVGMGLEMEVAPQLVMGTAFGYSDGLSRPDGRARTEARTSQLAVYGSYRLGGGAYVAGVASMDMSRFNLARDVAAGPTGMNLNSATNTSRMGVRAEAGVNLAMAGLMLTPRVAVEYSSYRLDGFREQGGEAALMFDELGIEQLESRIGAQLSGTRRLGGGWSFVPQLQADMVRLLAGGDQGMTVRFALAPEQAIALPLSGGDTMWGEVRGGFRLANGPLEFGAALETSVGRAFYQDDRAVADVTFRF